MTTTKTTSAIKTTKTTSNKKVPVAKKGTATKKETASTKETTASTKEVAASTKETVSTEEVNLISYDKEFSNLYDKFTTITALVSSLRNDTKLFEKRVMKDMKSVNKDRIKAANKKNTTRPPSGIVKATEISDELALFLDKAPGTLLARTEATAMVTAFVKQNGLQDHNNGRLIIPNPALLKLLQVPADVKLTYFNLQKYMAPHFCKDGEKVVNGKVVSIQ